jgi:hypothetical protein
MVPEVVAISRPIRRPDLRNDPATGFRDYSDLSRQSDSVQDRAVSRYSRPDLGFLPEADDGIRTRDPHLGKSPGRLARPGFK